MSEPQTNMPTDQKSDGWADKLAEDLSEDAQIDGLNERSWTGGFLRGIFFGGLGAAAALVGLSLSYPLPDHLPGVGSVDVVADRPTSEAGSPAASPEGTSGEVSTASEAETSGDASATDPEAAAPPAETRAVETEGESSAPDAVPQVTSPEAQGTQVEPDAAVESPSASDSTASPTQDEATSETAEVGTETAGETGAETSTPDPTNAETRVEAGTAETSASEPTTVQSAEVGAEADGEAPAAQAVDDQVIAAVTPGSDARSSVDEVDVTPPEFQAPEQIPFTLSGPAIRVNARPFDAPPNAPLMAVVMDDPGKAGIAPGALTLMTMPLTFALRPDRDDAQDLALAAQSAGHEVLVTLPMAPPEGDGSSPNIYGTAQTPEALADLTRAYLGQLQVAIGATAPEGASQLTDRRAMEAILAPLGEHGFAYLDLRAGIGSSARRIADAEGLTYAESNRYAPAASTEEQIYQMLNGAAFQARRQGSSIVAIGASTAALKAVVRWGLERGGQEVWFAPLSAVIARREQD